MNALWRRLDVPGHDAAVLRPQGEGWKLSGFAAFGHGDGPAGLAYSVEVDRHWAANRGSVKGFVGDRSVEYEIRRDSNAWRLNGAAVEGLSHLFDLDLGFTPATNMLQLRRAGPSIGQKVSLPAAWFDIDEGTLTELPQIYERLSETTYRYVARSVSYEGLLEFTSDGFVKIYPHLWRLETGLDAAP
jgi:hypothetical protein